MGRYSPVVVNRIYLPRNLGSRTSLNASPNMFMPNTTKVSAKPGKSPIQGAPAKSNNCCWFNMAPHVMVLPAPLRPRKLRDASMIIALPTKDVDITTNDAKVLGSKCLNIILVSLPPIALDASIYGISFTLRATDLTTLDILGKNTIVMARITLFRDEPNAAIRASASKRLGKADRESTTLWIIRSYLPP